MDSLVGSVRSGVEREILSNTELVRSIKELNDRVGSLQEMAGRDFTLAVMRVSAALPSISITTLGP